MLGVLSLIFWSLIIIVSIKYLLFVMRADNQGEGGILALIALVRGRTAASRTRRHADRARPVRRGAALRRRHDHAGDLGARARSKGSSVATPSFEPFVVPITVVDPDRAVPGPAARHGRHRHGVRAGHDRLVRHASRVLGLPQIVREPGRARARSIRCTASRSSPTTGWHGFLDARRRLPVGHRRRGALRRHGPLRPRPIRIAWFALVLPALRAQLLRPGRAAARRSRRARRTRSSSWRRRWALYPLVVLATMADGHRVAGADLRRVLADAAGDAARLLAALRHRAHVGAREGADLHPGGQLDADDRHASASSSASASSTNLAAAYGIAVTTTMVITTLLAFVVARERWGWSLWRAGLITARVPRRSTSSFFGANVHQDPARRLVPAAGRGAWSTPDDDVEDAAASWWSSRLDATEVPLDAVLQRASRRRRRCACRAPRSS